MNKTGYVQFVDGRKITVDGETYSAFSADQIKCRVGDYVSFEFTEKAGTSRTGSPVVYKNVRGNVIPTTGGGPAVTGVAVPPPGFSPVPYKAPEEVGKPILSKDRLILRQNALTAAVNFINGSRDLHTVFTTHSVIETAKAFEYYTSGDMDVDAAEEALKSDKAE